MPKFLLPMLIVLAGTAFAEDEVPNDPPGHLRHDADGNAQMWGGPPLEEITDPVRFQILLAESTAEPVLLFKHSTQCPISARAAARLSEFKDEMGEEAPKIYWLKVIESRPVSNDVASRLGVKHESPQIILIENAKAVWDASHDAITADAIIEALLNTQKSEVEP